MLCFVKYSFLHRNMTELKLGLINVGLKYSLILFSSGLSTLNHTNRSNLDDKLYPNHASFSHP